MQLQSAIQHYNDLAQSGTLAQESWAVLAPGMAERHLMFGERPLCTVLRPLFHTAAGWRYLRQRTELVLGAFNRLNRAMLADPALRAQVRLTPDEEYLSQLPTGFDTAIPTARLDSFFRYEADGSYTLNYIEFNGESPAGIAYQDVLAELFLQTPLLEQFQRHHRLRWMPGRPHLLEALLRIYAQWRGSRDKLPQMAIVDWKGVPTTTEFLLIQAYFDSQGIPVTICSPDEVAFDGRQVTAAGTPVDFIYKRVLITELLQTYGLEHPIVRALEAGAACIANPFNCKLLHKKASFAVASDERNAHLLTAVERAAVQAHIPWTRLIEERRTLDVQGRPIDLLPWASANRDHLVLKPNDEYGGKGVLIGWETDQERWDRALQSALQEPIVVQERAQIAYELFPSLDEQGRVVIGERLVDCDPFLFHGDAVGSCLTRLSSVTLLNVTAGGGSVVPVFVMEE